MKIRLTAANDQQAVCTVQHSAFSEVERDSIVELTLNFLSQPSEYLIFSFLAEEKEAVVGHVIFSEIRFEEQGASAFILAPLAVVPARQKVGIGGELVKHGLNYLTSAGAELIFVYGDPAYYSRFGFLTEKSGLFIPPYKLQYPDGWQYLQLNNSPLPSAPVQLICAPPLQNSELW